MSDLGVAVVTGGSGLIGRAVCSTLAEAGHSVVAVDRNAKSLAELAEVVPAGLHTVHADVTDHAQTSEIWRSAEWARDVRSLVCVAGDPRSRGQRQSTSTRLASRACWP